MSSLPVMCLYIVVTTSVWFLIFILLIYICPKLPVFPAGDSWNLLCCRCLGMTCRDQETIPFTPIQPGKVQNQRQTSSVLWLEVVSVVLSSTCYFHLSTKLLRDITARALCRRQNLPVVTENSLSLPETFTSLEMI